MRKFSSNWTIVLERSRFLSLFRANDRLFIEISHVKTINFKTKICRQNISMLMSSAILLLCYLTKCACVNITNPGSPRFCVHTHFEDPLVWTDAGWTWVKCNPGSPQVSLRRVNRAFIFYSCWTWWYLFLKQCRGVSSRDHCNEPYTDKYEAI